MLLALLILLASLHCSSCSWYKFGIYTSKGPLTCLGTQKTQPQRPGSCGYEQIDADTYAHDWQVDQVYDGTVYPLAALPTLAALPAAPH